MSLYVGNDRTVCIGLLYGTPTGTRMRYRMVPFPMILSDLAKYSMTPRYVKSKVGAIMCGELIQGFQDPEIPASVLIPKSQDGLAKSRDFMIRFAVILFLFNVNNQIVCQRSRVCYFGLCLLGEGLSPLCSRHILQQRTKSSPVLETETTND